MSLKTARLAIELMGIMGMFGKFDRALQSMRNESPVFAAAQIVNSMPEIAKEVETIFTEGVIELTNATAAIYMNIFTNKELKKLTKFYKSKTGKKFVSSSIQVEEQVIKASTIWMTGALTKMTEFILAYTAKINENTEKINPVIPVSTKLH